MEINGSREKKTAIHFCDQYFVFCWGLDREGVGVLKIEGSVGGWGVIILLMFYAFFTQTRFSFNIFLLQSQFVGVGCRPIFFVGVRWDRPNMGRGGQYNIWNTTY